jgi:hypothetical protein
LEGDELKLGWSLVFASLALGGCTLEDRLILPRESSLVENPKLRGGLYRSSSFWSLARTVESNAPRPGEAVLRKGRLSFSGRKFLHVYDFTYDYRAPKHWDLILFEKGTTNRNFSLHRNHLGLTLQDVNEQVFEQSFEADIWKRLSQHPWFDSLEVTLKALNAPKFSPELDWHEEVDGFKYYVITRVDQARDPHNAVKHEVYLHKKGKTMNRHIKTKLDVGIVEDLRYSRFKGVGHSYLPHGIMVELPKKGKRVDVSISDITIDATAKPPSALREL